MNTSPTSYCQSGYAVALACTHKSGTRSFDSAFAVRPRNGFTTRRSYVVVGFSFDQYAIDAALARPQLSAATLHSRDGH